MKRAPTETEDSRCLRLLKQFCEAWDAGDVDKLMSMMTDDSVFSLPSLLSTMSHGHELNLTNCSSVFRSYVSHVYIFLPCP